MNDERNNINEIAYMLILCVYFLNIYICIKEHLYEDEVKESRVEVGTKDETADGETAAGE